MTDLRRAAVVVLTLALSVPALAQSDRDSRRDNDRDRDRDQDPTATENDRFRRLVERIAQPPQTERDKVLEEITEAIPKSVLGADAEHWFDTVAGGETTWDRRKITDGGLRDIFDRVLTRLKMSGNTISRADFRAYAREYLAADRSPPWREPRERDWSRESDRIFGRLDRNNDRLLADVEAPTGLRNALTKWDADGDRFISTEEYRAYFPERLRQATREFTPAVAERGPAARAIAGAGGPPAWFTTLDADADGQVGLYEWRRAWPVKEFVQLDGDRDGFLTTDELRRLLAATGADRVPLIDDLARRKLSRSNDR
jgi:hypothetical protein